MAERPLLELAVDRLFGKRKSFIIHPVHTRVEDLVSSKSGLRISPVPLRPQEKRMMNNLELSVYKTPSKSGVAEIRIRETNDVPHSSRRLSLDDVRLEDGVIRIGEDIVILLRSVSRAGRRKLIIARPEDVNVHSKQHRKVQESAKLAA